MKMSAEQLNDALDAGDGSAWSALADGELTEVQCAALWRGVGDRGESYAAWQSYQIIGEVLRGEHVALRQSPQDFLAGVRAGLARDEAQVPVRPVLTQAPVLMPQVRGDAANDAVLRWKWVAGLASLTAVAAFSWALVGQVAPSGSGSAGPVMAQAPSAAAVAEARPTASSAGSALVVVKTEQGRLIRDPALERMLAEHRQHGSMSALQMPAGFLRNATYDDHAGQ